jgi:membrane protease YdiL (CAAX protease family)
MDPVLLSTLLKLALPCATIALVLLISRWRGVDWRNDLRLGWPRPSQVLIWIAIWVAWVAAGEVAIRLLGMAPPAPWKDYPPLIVVLRIAAIGILGPVSEEILMRGMIFWRISRTRLGPVGAILICAVAWAAMHYHYDWKTIVMIFLDGIVLGVARHHTRSTQVPILMHILGNLLSIWQSLHP